MTQRARLVMATVRILCAIVILEPGTSGAKDEEVVSPDVQLSPSIRPEYDIHFRPENSSERHSNERTLTTKAPLSIRPVPAGRKASPPPPASPGLAIGSTSWDAQHHMSQGYQTARTSTATIVHFVWTNWDRIPSNISDNDRFVAYNSYNIGTATLNQGFGGAFVALGASARAGYINMDVGTDNTASVSCHQREDVSLPYNPWHLNFLSPGAVFHIDDGLAGYEAAGCPEVLYPRNAASRNTANTGVRHEIAHSNTIDCPNDVLWYWRYDGAAWTGPVILDSTPLISYVIADDPNSNKLAVGVHVSNYASMNGINNVAYIESITDGVGWIGNTEAKTKNVITSYNDACSAQAWRHLSATYDNTSGLHIVWDEQRFANTTADVAIRHWSSSLPVIRPVAYGYYPSPHLIGAYDLNLSKLTVGIGDGGTVCGAQTNNNYVYVLYTKFGGTSATELADHSAAGYYNGELYLTTSSSGGNTWSPPVNLTNTKTPGCNPGAADTLTGLPPNPDMVCRSEHWATLGRVVRDIDILFVSDLDAGGIPYGEGTWQLNPVNYLRLPGQTANAQHVCPVIAANFFATVASNSVCQYHATQAGSANESLTIQNLGAAAMNGTITVTDFPGAPTLTLSGGAGAYSIASGGADIVKTLTMSSNGAAQGLYTGQVSITHNDASKPSPFVIPIQFLIDNLYACFPCPTFDSSLCPDNLIGNGSFVTGAIAGPMPSPGTASNWSRGYGNPVVSTALGCEDAVYVSVTGNKHTGSAVVQQLNSPIQAGQLYELRICVRVNPTSPISNVKLRAMAFNGTLPTSGTHPQPSANIALIDVSGTIHNNDWTTYTFHQWLANYNFDKIAIAVENADTVSNSIADIDNVCLIETDSLQCYLVEMDSLGNVVYPPSLDPENPPVEEDVDLFTGSVNDLYAPCNPNGLDTWYENCPDSCASIGGTIPQSVQDDIINFNLQDSLTALGINLPAEDILDSLEAMEELLEGYAGNLLDTLFSLGALPRCVMMPPKGPPPSFTNSPFQGRDIVFVHGFQTEPICDRMDGVAGAQTKWPQNRSEFYDDGNGGYWKEEAEAYWRSHIRKYLGVDPNPATHPMPDNGFMNRFIVVAHPATQSGVRAIHAINEQILEAMISGRDVRKCSPADSRPLNTFGQNGFIIVSHSAGALFSNVAMKVSKLTSTNPLLGLMLGDISVVADRCDLHVALNGAFMGSNYASLALLGLSSPPLVVLASAVLDSCDPAGHPWLFTSQLLDMAIARYMYGGPLFQKLCGALPLPLNLPFCLMANENLMEPPMCVLTVSGGHPSEYGISGTSTSRNPLLQVVVKHLIHHGVDDGVVSADCACGNSDRRIHYPNRYLASPGLLTLAGIASLGPPGGLLNERIYDMGIKPERAVGYYLDQKLDILTSELLLNVMPPQNRPTWWSPSNQIYNFQLTSAACIPWLSPTGMVQPVLVSRLPGEEGHDALKRLDNHYSFLQSAADHYTGATHVGLSGPFPDYYTSYSQRNWEEVRVVTSNDVYTSKCGVNDTLKFLQGEHVRGKKITFSFKLFGKKWSKSFWIWKRKYHYLQGSGEPGGGKNQLDYVYDYVLKP